MQTDTAPKKRKPNEYRKLAATKARGLGLPSRYISQYGKYDDCMLFVETGQWPEIWGEAKPALALVKTPLPQVLQSEPVKTTLPGTTADAVNTHLPAKVENAVNTTLPHNKRKKAAKGVLANGRSEKGTPKFENWFCRIYPKDITYPAWKGLSKTATDIANICFAKRDHAKAGQRAKGKRENDIDPLFQFTFKEAAGFFRISRPTFEKSMKQLMSLGFIERVAGGGIFDGKGVPATYRCIDAWRNWQPAQRAKGAGNDCRKTALQQLRKTNSQ